ncbi:MAG: SusC/RagA family TonB-linked outer membrane protein [Rikenellaceae bacterium]
MIKILNECCLGRGWTFKLLLIVMLSVQTLLVSAQSSGSAQRVSGVVTDESGVAIIGANVILDGAQGVGTITDMKGEFSINVPSNSSLTISYIGYTSKSISVGTRTQIDVSLNLDTQSINEIVVVGYGSARKGDLTGSVASLNVDELPSTSNTTIGQALKGQVAGLVVSQNSTQPGGSVSMQIRGSASGASPLIVIDGVQVSGVWDTDAALTYTTGSKESVLDAINPDDIESITVLKDASATSIYGSQASGGVILITTKRGSEDGKVKVSFKGSYTTQRIDKITQVLDAKDFMTQTNRLTLENYIIEQGYYPYGDAPRPQYDDLVSLFESDYSEMSYNGWVYNPEWIDSYVGGTNWYDEVTRNGAMQRYDLSIAGGDKKSSYLISAGYMSNDGVFVGNSYSRYTARINYDVNFNKWLKAGVTSSFSSVKSSDSPLSSVNSQSLNGLAQIFDPTIPVYDENGDFSITETSTASDNNPLSLLSIALESTKQNLLGSAFVEIKPIEELTVKFLAGYDYKQSSAYCYLPSWTNAGRSEQGNAKIAKNDLNNFNTNITATYNKLFAGDHRLSAMVGWEYTSSNRTSISAENNTFPYDAVLWNNLGLGSTTNAEVASSKSLSESVSAMARINYSFRDKYILTANYRHDGSSNFAPNKQWGDFGGVSIGWRLEQEEWLKDVSWLTNLKIRGGYGLTGNAGSLTGIYSYYEAGTNYYFNNTETSGVALAAIGNSDLTWESQSEINVGLDFGFVEGRFGGSIDLYKRTVYDRIGQKSLMSFQEISTVNYNTERIDNTRGLDLMLYANVMNRENFTWDVQTSVTFYRDYTSKRDPSEVYSSYLSEQYNWGDWWSYLSDGIIQPGESVSHMTDAMTGQVKIQDVNGFVRDEYGVQIFDVDGRAMLSGMPDGTINEADMVFLKNTTPIPFSIYNKFKYKAFDLSINIYGEFNTMKANDTYGSLDYTALLRGVNTDVQIKDIFSIDNPNSTIPGLTQASSSYGTGNYFLESSAFARIDNITFGYTLNRKQLRGVAQSFRAYISIDNIATITGYSGYDPEYSVNTYPTVKSFTFGVDVNF